MNFKVIKENYQRHYLKKHPVRSGYPGLADIKEMGLTAESRPWEF